MKKFKTYELLAIILITATLLFVACSSGNNNDGSNNGDPVDAVVSGVVADGYVSNASVYVYSDADMTTLLGSGVTDSNGNYSITLSVSSVPEPVYLKSVGGTDVDTGMPAPTMFFVATGATGPYNITPLTDCLYKYSQTLGIGGAMNYLTGQLGISNTELYDDPVANTDLNDALNRILASGAMDGTLTDGEYVVKIAYFEWDNGDVSEMNVTISNGVVSGDADLWGDAWFVTGRVQGSSIVLTLADQLDPDSASDLIRMAGNIGLMGSITGMYTYVGSGDPEIYSGMFVAGFVPADGLDSSGVVEVVANLYSGSRHFIIRDIFGGTYKLAWGDLNIDIDAEAGTVTADDTTMWFDFGSDPDDENFSHPGDFPATLEFVQGEFLETSDEIRTPIIHLEFSNDDFNGSLEFYQAVGSRRGIFVISGDFLAIGDAYMATGEGLAPSLEADTNYNVKIAAAHVSMLGQSRSDWIGSGVDEMPYSDSYTTPEVFDITD